MVGLGITATFSDLPTEMKAAIFANIHQNPHRKAVCLASREWRDIMRPIFWETLFLECATDPPGDLGALLSAGNGALPHIRYIHIYANTKEMVHFNPISNFGVAVRLIIGALQRDSLLGVTFDLAVSISILLSLLQSQKSLKTLRIREAIPDDSPSLSMSLITHDSWVAPTLNSILELRIPVSIHDDKTYTTSAYLLKNTPRLQSLCLIGEIPTSPLMNRSGEHDAFGGPYADGAAIQTLQLDSLQLLWLNIQTYPASIFSRINFSGLRSLYISQCRFIGAFLSAHVAAFPRATALRNLEISVIPGPNPLDKDIQAMEAMVASAPWLEELWLDVGRGRAINVSCLAGLGQSLRHLALTASYGSQPPPYYTSSELGKLLKQIPSLERLYINLCPIALGKVQHLAVKFRLSEQAEDGSDSHEATALLSCIAAHQGLKSLRTFTTPIMNFGIVPNPSVEDRIELPEEHVYTAQVMMQSFATEVFRYLVKHGSRISSFTVSPDFIRVERPIGDENGHMWPRYFYTRGFVRTMGGEEHVVAVPQRVTEMQLTFRTAR